MLSALEEAALLAYEGADDEETFAASQWAAARAEGIPVCNYKSRFLQWRGTNDARLTLDLYRALWTALRAPKTLKVFIALLYKKYRSACTTTL
jgi:hypothetical protein